MATTQRPLIHRDPPRDDPDPQAGPGKGPAGRKAPPWALLAVLALVGGVAAYMYLGPSAPRNEADPQVNRHADEIGEALRKNEPPPVVPRPEAPPPGYDAPKSIRGKK
ncbi:MAG: hypothetical protein JNJ48_08325 [Phycisphaerae bacterium]|nr:hypothetical protein [Phycisphaerae bacterium]